ncbi:hypothetical protein KCU81_g8775, partial [Aureobasidium melanogenum]
MVHRAIQVHWQMIEHKPTQLFLTKGDNNEADDVALYPRGRFTVARNEVIGLVRGYVPLLGWIAIMPKDFYRSSSKYISEKVRRLRVI